MHLLVTRPEPDVAELRGRIEALGHRVTVCPLIAIEYIAAEPVSLDGVEALIATSRNAIRGLARTPAFDKARTLALFAVGPGTAAEARAAGFSRVIEGPAAARDLVPVIAAEASPARGALLHVCGDVLAFDLKGALAREGFAVREHTVYRARSAAALDPAVVQAIRSGALEGVILMSPRTGSIFAELAAAAGVADAARRLAYFCLSDAVAASLERLRPTDVRVARRPNAEEVLALLAPAAPESG